MLLGQIFSALFVALGLVATYFILKYKKIEIPNIAYKITSVILAAVFFFRYMWGPDAYETVYRLTNSPVSWGKAFTAISLILNTLLQPTSILFALYPFFKNQKITTVVKYWGLLVGIICFSFIVPVTEGIVGVTAYTGFNFRTILMGLEIALITAYSFVLFMENGKFKVSKKHLYCFLYLIPMVIFAMMSYVPQALVGYVSGKYVIDDLELYHRIFIYFGFIVPILIFFALKNRSYSTKRFMLLVVSISALFVFLNAHRFESWLDPTSWPLHLCHTAMFIVPICLLFKWDKLFYFTYFINVLGAFFAMAMPDTDAGTNMLATSLLRFWSNHYFAFFMPLLCVALKMFTKPKLKQFMYSSIAFTVYFFAIIFVNAYMTGVGRPTDFFYTNSDFIVDKLGVWAENLRNVTVVINIGDVSMLLYPLYQILYWLVYIGMAAGMWFLYELVYNYTDVLNEVLRRRKKYKLEELALLSQLNGRSKEETIYMENGNKMMLHNFTKIYGKSNVYAVKDANLEIVGGEIFGFLGPNGAGKSTIIKSIVGIQPITDGSIEVCGYDVDKQSVMAKKQIGFVPDHYALYEKLTGREYINYIADLYEVSQEDRDARINRYVEIFELQTAFDNQMKTYSHGMKQKIAIMAALVHNPKVWILDEPLTGLDPNSIFQVKECMKQHAKEGNIVFFSSHIIDVVEKICDRIGIIKKGQIQTVKTIKEIEESGTTLEDFYMDIIENKKVDAIPVKPEKETVKTVKEKPKKDKKDKKPKKAKGVANE